MIERERGEVGVDGEGRGRKDEKEGDVTMQSH